MAGGFFMEDGPAIHVSTVQDFEMDGRLKAGHDMAES
jgi:hypothetical protein